MGLLCIDAALWACPQRTCQTKRSAQMKAADEGNSGHEASFWGTLGVIMPYYWTDADVKTRVCAMPSPFRIYPPPSCTFISTK